MSVQLVGRDVIVLEGHCPSEDAEHLLQRLLAMPAASVDLRTCTALHTAVIQVLLAAAPALTLPPAGTAMGNRLAAQLSAVITR